MACAENDMHLRQIADDTVRDVQHQRRSARRKMTRILRIDISGNAIPDLVVEAACPVLLAIPLDDVDQT